MSEENIEAARQALDAVNRRDRVAFQAVCDPELENTPPQDWPESRTTRGSHAVFDFYLANTAPWGEAQYEYVGLIEAGDDKTLGEVRAEVQGKGSGAEVTWSFWQVGTFHNGKFARIEWFSERADALEAAGLSE